MSMKYSINAQNAAASSSTSWILKCTDLPQFDALQAQADLFVTDDKLHLRNLCGDSARCQALTAAIHGSATRNNRTKLILDYSRQRVTGETMELLFDLADAVRLTDRREAMQKGKRINATEDRAVLHHVLRMPADYDLVLVNEPVKNRSSTQQHQPHPEPLDGPNVLRQVHAVRESIETFSSRVRSGEYRSVTGKEFRNVLCVGLGGWLLGPECVAEALQADPAAAQAAQGRTLRFLSNVDPVDFHLCTRDLEPAETLVIVVCKTFMAAETMLNARTVRKWLVHHLTDGKIITETEIVAKHMIAVSCSPSRCNYFGIAKENVFGFWDWVGGRYSVSSAVGLLPLSLQYSYPVMLDFLAGAHDMDEHFFHAPLRDNIPTLLGLLGVWNSTFLGYSCRAILPYSRALSRFPAYVQHVDMESNGKRVALDGTPLLHRSGVVNFGEPGTNGQHSFYQLMHQGRVVPADFIGFMESQQPIDLPGEAVSNHDELMSNFFAQPDALAYGKTLVDLIQEGAPEPLREHMVLNGNRPSSSILMTRLDAYAIGQLVALYEHRAAVQGFVWGINSFDQFGIDLGKTLAKHVRAQLSASRKTEASVQGFNVSTSTLLEHYLAHGKHVEQPSSSSP